MVKHKTAAPEAKRTPTRAEVKAVQKVAKKSSQSREESAEESHEDSDVLLGTEEEDDDEEEEEEDPADGEPGREENEFAPKVNVYTFIVLHSYLTRFLAFKETAQAVLFGKREQSPQTFAGSENSGCKGNGVVVRGAHPRCFYCRFGERRRAGISSGRRIRARGGGGQDWY